MLVATLHPGFVPEGVPPLLDWKESSNLGNCDKECLLWVLAMSIVTELILMILVGYAVLEPCSLRTREFNDCQRKAFASFIYRRLLHQLDQALCQQVRIPEEEPLDSCLRSSEKIILAIQLFRRDALKVLQPGQDISSMFSSDLYYVLDEEEHELASSGYGCSHTKVEVTEELLMYLIYPERSNKGS
ncbi:uncharacterized protein LOC108113309 [Drosophila eugracilis]|uniref:uncharacterized protein LOC108113309 n=1 Tax=Drosophila eugracilis TaxID=29029 RepID=UPI0007E71752|nr:uncharacterized protein LOC108113309 [Drosophila eugracilis]